MVAKNQNGVNKGRGKEPYGFLRDAPKRWTRQRYSKEVLLISREIYRKYVDTKIKILEGEEPDPETYARGDIIIDCSDLLNTAYKGFHIVETDIWDPEEDLPLVVAILKSSLIPRGIEYLLQGEKISKKFPKLDRESIDKVLRFNIRRKDLGLTRPLEEIAVMTLGNDNVFHDDYKEGMIHIGISAELNRDGGEERIETFCPDVSDIVLSRQGKKTKYLSLRGP